MYDGFMLIKHKKIIYFTSNFLYFGARTKAVASVASCLTTGLPWNEKNDQLRYQLRHSLHLKESLQTNYSNNNWKHKQNKKKTSC